MYLIHSQISVTLILPLNGLHYSTCLPHLYFMWIYLKNEYCNLQEGFSIFSWLYLQDDFNATTIRCTVHAEKKALIVWRGFQMEDVLMNINYLCFIKVNRVAP